MMANRISRRTTIKVAGGAAASLVGLSGYGRSARAQGLDVLKIGVPPFVNQSAIFLAPGVRKAAQEGIQQIVEGRLRGSFDEYFSRHAGLQLCVAEHGDFLGGDRDHRFIERGAGPLIVQDVGRNIAHKARQSREISSGEAGKDNFRGLAKSHMGDVDRAELGFDDQIALRRDATFFDQVVELLRTDRDAKVRERAAWTQHVVDVRT